MSEIKFRIRDKVTGVIVAYESWSQSGLWEWSGNGIQLDSVRGNACMREQFTTFYESVTNQELYVGDKISVADPSNKAHRYEGLIVFDMGCFSLRISKGTSLMYDIGSTPPLYNFTDFKKK